jgi:hypothetical protein
MTYKKLIEDGWIDTQLSFAGWAILAKGKDRILFDKESDMIFIEYTTI